LGPFVKYFYIQFNIYRCAACSPTPFTTLTKSLFDYEQTDYDYYSTNSNSRSDSNDLYEQKWWELQEIVPQDIVVIEARQPKSLYRSQRHFYGTENSIWASFGPVGSTEK
jgi:hypothetical protein